jgi:hypothetical protein
VIAGEEDDELPVLGAPTEERGVERRPYATQVSWQQENRSHRCQYTAVLSIGVIVKMKVTGVLELHILLKAVYFLSLLFCVSLHDSFAY